MWLLISILAGLRNYVHITVYTCSNHMYAETMHSTSTATVPCSYICTRGIMQSQVFKNDFVETNQ